MHFENISPNLLKETMLLYFFWYSALAILNGTMHGAVRLPLNLRRRPLYMVSAKYILIGKSVTYREIGYLLRNRCWTAWLGFEAVPLSIWFYEKVYWKGLSPALSIWFCEKVYWKGLSRASLYMVLWKGFMKGFEPSLSEYDFAKGYYVCGYA